MFFKPILPTFNGQLMRNIWITSVLILVSQLGFNQDYQEKFLEYCETKDTINQLKTLKQWHSNSPKDAELFTSYFNYHFYKSRKEVVALTTTPPSGESLALIDSTDQTAAYMESTIYFDQIELRKGLDKIDEGIMLYPNRLDMRFGKIYVLGQIPDWKNFTSEIIKTVEYSNQNNNQWTWTNHIKYDGGEREFLLDIQDYQLQLYNTGNDNLLLNIRQIANAVLNFYPNHVESLSNLSITYLLTGEYDKGIEPLLKAEKINPKDHIVLGNIAQGYKLKGDVGNAIRYYKKVVQHGDEAAKKYAKEQIAELE